MKVNLIFSVFLLLWITACRNEQERYLVGTWQWSLGKDTLNLYFHVDNTYYSDAGAEGGTWANNSDFNKFNRFATRRTAVRSYDLIVDNQEREGWLKWTRPLNVYTYEYEYFEGNLTAGDRIYTRIYTSLWGVE